MIRKYLSSDRVGVRSKLAQKYDKTSEAEVIKWIDELTGIKLEAGIYKMGRQLKNGQTLVKLAEKIQKDTSDCPEAAKSFMLKLNTDNAPFKQMENIQVFLGFCERYGVPISGLFHTKDLFDGNNMQQVFACIIQLGTETQRNHFTGPTIGPKPQEKNIRDFSTEKLKASHSFLAMQGGVSAPSLDFQMGAVRRIVDSRTESGMTGKGGKTPEVVNGVPDLLDIGKKGKKKEKVYISDEESDKNENGDLGEKKNDSDNEIKEKEKSPPIVKNKPEKKERKNGLEMKTRERKKDKSQENEEESEINEDNKKEKKKLSRKTKKNDENLNEEEENVEIK